MRVKVHPPESVPRPAFCHTKPCVRCPSAHFPPDPEAEDIRAMGRDVVEESAFACAWRPDGYCVGWLRMGATMIAITLLASCGRPTITELLSGIRIVCDATVSLPTGRPGETVSATVTLERCREVGK